MNTHFAVLPLDVIDTVVSQLPDEIASSPHFLHLPHPRTGIASLFLAHEPARNEDGHRKHVSKILEVQAVGPPNARSWFMGDEVISDGKLLVMTPVDPLFLLIPMLQAIKHHDGGIGNFRPAEDIFEDVARAMGGASTTSATQTSQTSVEMEDVIKFSNMECTKIAMGRLCDVKEITPEITVFRYSPDKLVHELRKKVVTLSTPRVAEMSRCLVRSLAKDALMEDKHEDLLELGRTKLACDLLGQYLPQDIHQALLASYDLGRLDAHVRALAKEQSLIAPEGNASSKKSKTGPAAGSTKRKKDEKGSQGVERLKRVNVSGMSKLSRFFTKKVDS